MVVGSPIPDGVDNTFKLEAFSILMWLVGFFVIVMQDATLVPRGLQLNLFRDVSCQLCPELSVLYPKSVHVPSKLVVGS